MGVWINKLPAEPPIPGDTVWCPQSDVGWCYHREKLVPWNLLLVGGWPIPLKNMKVNWDDDIPKIWKNKTCSSHHQPVIAFKQHWEWRLSPNKWWFTVVISAAVAATEILGFVGGAWMVKIGIVRCHPFPSLVIGGLSWEKCLKTWKTLWVCHRLQEGQQQWCWFQK